MTASIQKKLTLPLVILLVLIILIIAGYVMVDKFLSEPIEIKNIKIDTKAALKLNALKQISKKNGIKEWELTATSATLLKKKNQAVLVDVFVKFYTKDQKRVELKSKTGILNTKTHDMTFTDHVVVTYEGAVLTTDQLQYHKKEHIIFSDSHVTLKKLDSMIEGDSMITELNTGKVILKGRVKGLFSENFRLE